MENKNVRKSCTTKAKSELPNLQQQYKTQRIIEKRNTGQHKGHDKKAQ